MSRRLAAGRSKPGTAGSQGTRRGTAASGRSGQGLQPVPEGEDSEYLGTELSALVPRARYQAPPGYYGPSLTHFYDYLKETEVEFKFRTLLHMLLGRPELPYNPYPGFYNRLRTSMEKFHLEQESEGKIKASQRNPLQDTYIQNLFTLKGREDVWGLSSILRVVNPSGLDKFRWLVQDITPDLDDLETSEDYSNQVMVALIGPAVFEGSFYPTTHSISIRLEFLVTGPDVSEGIAIFVNSMMSEIDRMFQSEHHFLLGVNVPTVDSQGVWKKHFWEPEKIQEDKENLLQKMSDAVIGNKYIFVECIFLRDPQYPSYIRGEKQYGFNFIEVIDELREEGLSSFCEYPMASLHEGVFLDRAHAEAYVSIFQPQLEDFDQVAPQEAGIAGQTPTGSRTVTAQGRSGTAQGRSVTAQGRSMTAQSRNRRLSVSQAQGVFAIQKHVNNHLEQIQPRKIRIDGFRFGDDTSSGPYAWQITTPIKSFYQKKIASHWHEAELFDIVYCMIVLLLLDREVYDDALPVELYRLLHATAGRLYSLMEHNNGLRAVIQALANTTDYPIIKDLLLTYMSAVENLFQNSLVERSQDQMTIGRAISARVYDMIYSQDLEFASASHIQTTLRGLKNINLYCLTLLMELAEDSLKRCPVFEKLIITMSDTFTEENPRPATRYKSLGPGFRAGEQEINLDEEFQHGIEDEHIKKHETAVLNVQSCVDRDMSPQTMVKDNVLLKYMLDCHIDEMWNDYLVDLAGGDVFPPNPYPRLISVLRGCAMKMDLFYEKSSTIVEKLFNLEVKLTDKENYIFSVPGIDAHGSSTALMLLDTGAYLPISETLKQFTQKSYVQRKGSYRVGICLALSGSAIWYGQTQPYLNEIELHEHYYVQGPAGCQGEAIQLCALIVHNHVSEMVQKSGLPVMGVYFGAAYPNHWTWDDVLTKKRGFLTEFATICARKEPIYMKAYVIVDGWRYVLVKKYFKLHFLEDGTRSELFYPEDPTSDYRSVFLSKERAAFNYQNGGPPHGGNPSSVANVRTVSYQLEKNMYESQRKCDWLNFYRHLLLKELLNQSQTHIGDAWRMFHSMASQVEYVIAMMEALQDLIIISLQYQPYLLKQLVGGKKTSKQQSRSFSGQSQQKYVLPVDNGVLSKMVIAFYQKLMYVCEARLTMASKALADYIENKLKSALQFDPESGQPYLAVEDESLFRLEEMKSMMLTLQDTLSGDVQSICTPVTLAYQPTPLRTPQMVQGGTPRGTATQAQSPAQRQRPLPTQRPYRLQSEPSPANQRPLRPPSVESQALDDPDQYRLRPAPMTMSVPRYPD